MVRKLFRLVVSLLLLLAPGLAAQSTDTRQAATQHLQIQVPRVIRISGTLSDLATTTTSSLQTIVFTLYQDQAGTTPLWSETQNVQIGAHGTYQVLLGADTAEGIPLALFSGNEARWLGAHLNGQPEQHPLVMFVSVPYALKAADAETLGGKPPSSYVTVDPSDSSRNKATTAAPASGDKTYVPIIGDGYARYIAKFNANNTIVTSRIYENSTGIGINNTTPRSALDVTGETIADMLTLSPPSGASDLWSWVNGGTRFRLLWRPPDHREGWEIFSIYQGAVAIDHDNPRSALDINGYLTVNGRITLSQDLGTTTPTWNFDNTESRFRLFYQPTINTSGTVVMGATGVNNVYRLGVLNDFPRTSLDVWGEITATNRLTLAQDTGVTSPTWHLDNTNSLFRIYHQPNINTSGTTVLTATRTGRVGIGVNDPARTLDVAGMIGINGAGNGIVFPDGTSLTTAPLPGPIFGVCFSNAQVAQSCSCGHVVSQTLISGGESCSISGVVGPCTATSHGGDDFSYGACCVCS